MRVLAGLALALAFAAPALGQPGDMRVLPTPHRFDALVERIMVFRNDYAVRTLEASVAAGIEAPLRLYLTENANGTATLSYRQPSAVFRPYRHPALERLAAELDGVLERIAADAAGR